MEPQDPKPPFSKRYSLVDPRAYIDQDRYHTPAPTIPALPDYPAVPIPHFSETTTESSSTPAHTATHKPDHEAKPKHKFGTWKGSAKKGFKSLRGCLKEKSGVMKRDKGERDKTKNSCTSGPVPTVEKEAADGCVSEFEGKEGGRVSVGEEEKSAVIDGPPRGLARFRVRRPNRDVAHDVRPVGDFLEPGLAGEEESASEPVRRLKIRNPPPTQQLPHEELSPTLWLSDSPSSQAGEEPTESDLKAETETILHEDCRRQELSIAGCRVEVDGCHREAAVNEVETEADREEIDEIEKEREAHKKEIELLRKKFKAVCEAMEIEYQSGDEEELPTSMGIDAEEQTKSETDEVSASTNAGEEPLPDTANAEWDASAAGFIRGFDERTESLATHLVEVTRRTEEVEGGEVNPILDERGDWMLEQVSLLTEEAANVRESRCILNDEEIARIQEESTAGRMALAARNTSVEDASHNRLLEQIDTAIQSEVDNRPPPNAPRAPRAMLERQAQRARSQQSHSWGRRGPSSYIQKQLDAARCGNTNAPPYQPKSFNSMPHGGFRSNTSYQPLQHSSQTMSYGGPIHETIRPPPLTADFEPKGSPSVTFTGSSGSGKRQPRHYRSWGGWRDRRGNTHTEHWHFIPPPNQGQSSNTTQGQGGDMTQGQGGDMTQGQGSDTIQSQSSNTSPEHDSSNQSQGKNIPAEQP